MAQSDALARSIDILLWMVLPVVGGYLLWRLWLRGREGGEALASRVARVTSQTSILGIVSPMLVLVFWTSSLPAGKAVTLPVLGLLIHILGGAAGWAMARVAGWGAPFRGACFLGGASSNILTFGGIVTVLLLGTPGDPHAERALGEMSLYRICEAPFYYLVAWPLAAVLAARGGGEGGWAGAFRRSFQPFTLVPLAAMAIGWALNLAKVARPGALDGAAALLVRVNVTLLGVTVGLTLRRAALARQWKCCLGMSAIKFLLLPAAAVGAAWLLGFSGTTLQVVAVCASMPVAFMAVVGGNLVGLDEEVLGSLWLFTTAAMLVVVPLLALGLPLLA